MPMYEFTCTACEHEFDELVKSANEVGSVICPTCRSKKVARKFSVFAARTAAAPSSAATHGGGCGRCGDPQGACGM